jgi:hypothetical protein
MNARLSTLIGAGVCGIVGFLLMGASGLGHEVAHDVPDMITVAGQTVPDIGPLPTAIPQPATNLNYASKISLGNGSQKTMPSPARFVITRWQDLPIPIKPQ